MGKYNKHYFEKYALLSICHLFNIHIEDFEKKSERPDLQSEALSIGVEVVRAITKHDGLTYSIADDNFGRGLSGEEIVASIKKNNNKGKFKGSVYRVGDVGGISSEEGMYDSSKHRNLVSEKIKEKSQLSKGYRHYRTNGLYCFTHTSLINETDYPYIIESCKGSSFNLILIDCIDTILQWNAPSDNLVKHKISEKNMHKWDQLALRQSEGEMNI